MSFDLVTTDIKDLDAVGDRSARARTPNSTSIQQSARNLNIAADRMRGATYSELVKKYGISNASISKILNRDEVKDVLQSALNHLASFAPILVKNYRDLLSSENEGIRLKATQTLSQILGFMPGTDAAQVINMYINKAEISGINDTMRQVISSIGTPRSEDVIDAEFTEILKKERV